MASSHATRVVSSSAPAAIVVDTNTTFVQADPATFRALVQKLTGAPGSSRKGAGVAQQPPARRPKLQERRRAAAPARLELARPQPSPLYYSHHHHRLMHSPVSPMEYACVVAASSLWSPSTSSTTMTLSPSPPASTSSSCGVVITKEEDEEREEKAIASKGFYLHSSPRSGGAGAGDGEWPKLLPLFPVHSPRS